MKVNFYLKTSNFRQHQSFESANSSSYFNGLEKSTSILLDNVRAEVEAFLTYLAVEGNVAASTQNQALSVVLFLYKEVLKINLPWLEEFTPAKKSERVPVVLTKREFKLILDKLKGTNWLIGNLLYGSGLWLIEALRLRVKDLDFGYRHITVRDGKGGNDRFTVLPTKLIEPIQKQFETVGKIHRGDLPTGLGRVEMPFALARKYPNAETEFCWQYVFPPKSLNKNPRTGKTERHHVSPGSLQKPFKEIMRKAGLQKRQVRTRFDIRLRRIFCRTDTIFAPFRNCSDIRN